jgi:release factor glutamine methyltransferase
MTWSEILTQGTNQLRQAHIASPNLDASLLLAHILGVSRENLLINGDRALKAGEISRFFDLISRRIAGENIAYITGYKEFWGLSFHVSPAVLVPRPDTEILVEAVLSYIQGQSFVGGQSSKKSQPAREIRTLPGDRAQKTPYSGDRASRNYSLLDLCTGSGAIAIALKSAVPDLEVSAADISPPALEIASANARRLLSGGQSLLNSGPDSNKEQDQKPALGFRGQSFIEGQSSLGALGGGQSFSESFSEGQSMTFYLSDLYAKIPGTFDIIVSNPPYIPSGDIASLPREVQREPRIALDGGRDGLELIKKIISGGSRRLTPGGRLFLEADPGQMSVITLILEKEGFQDILVYKDLAGLERVISGKRNG